MALARGLAARSEVRAGKGAEMMVVTQTPADGMDDSRLPFSVVRRPRVYELLKLMRSADVIHLANPALKPLIIGWILHKPVAIEHDGYQTICPNGLLIYEPNRSVCPGHFGARRYFKCLRCNSERLGWVGSVRSLLLTYLRRWLAHRVARNIAPTHHVGRRVALPRTHVIYHGVRKVEASDTKAVANHRETPTFFAYVGRLVPEKGLPALLHASSNLLKSGYSFRLRIIGDGPARRELEKMVEDLGLTGLTEFAGPVPVAATYSLLQEVTAVIMPSVWEDVAPLAASEQLMQGNLLIASDIGGLGEIVGSAGLTFAPGDYGALESCMRRAIENPTLADELRAEARRRGAQVFNEERMVEEHLQLYRELIESRSE